jgi:hypothetical protein
MYYSHGYEYKYKIYGLQYDDEDASQIHESELDEVLKDDDRKPSYLEVIGYTNEELENFSGI